MATRRRLRALAALAALACAAGPAGQDVDAAVARDIDRGEVALSLGQVEDAADAYRSALLLRPADGRALAGLARTELAQGRPESALQLIDRLERRDPRAVERELGPERRQALFEVAQLRLRRDDPAGALRLLDRLEVLDPGHPGLRALQLDALVAESGRLQLAGRSQEARALLRKAVGVDPPDESDLALSLARSLVEQGRLDTAISVLSDALLRDPDDARMRALMDGALRIRYPNGFTD